MERNHPILRCFPIRKQDSRVTYDVPPSQSTGKNELYFHVNELKKEHESYKERSGSVCGWKTAPYISCFFREPVTVLEAKWTVLSTDVNRSASEQWVIPIQMGW